MIRFVRNRQPAGGLSKPHVLTGIYAGPRYGWSPSYVRYVKGEPVEFCLTACGEVFESGEVVEPRSTGRRDDRGVSRDMCSKCSTVQHWLDGAVQLS